MSKKPQDLYKISDMANFFGVTTTTFRYYEQCGLLKPAYVDEKTKYRYYDVANVNTCAYILDMRRLGMGIREIEKYVKSSNYGNEYIDGLKRQRDYIDAALQKAEARFGKNGDYKVLVKTLPERLCYTKNCVAADLQQLYATYYDFLSDSVKSVTADGNLGTFIEFDNVVPQYENINAKLGVTVTAAKAATEILPACKCVSTFHLGEYEKLPDAYYALTEYAKSNGLKLNGNAFEYYYESFNLRQSPDAFLTEVYLPVE